ncbi:MAG TPA: endolytic transglycosylase MltG [Candidatus Caccousia avistercoris]|nr:endolytic transglycosylase MltG [Candidatus Caccousia avistercoris]
MNYRKWFRRALPLLAALTVAAAGCSPAGGVSQPRASAAPAASEAASQPEASPAEGASQTAEAPSAAAGGEEEPLTVTVTIPEGFTFLQIAQRLEASGVCSAQEFYETAQSYAPSSFTVPENPDRAYKMEGYLFPDTYEFYKDADPQQVLVRMLNNYREKAEGLTDEQLVIASIIERESRTEEAAALVSSVIYNRLEAGMPLQMDATREYVNQAISDSPLLSSSEGYAERYNTYKCPALPAGPICCPGLRAMEAARNPAESGYLYFFFGSDNQNHYSVTLEEHQAQMEQYGVQYG